MHQGSEVFVIEEILKKAGTVVLASFGQRVEAERKDERSQIVTKVDVASERIIIQDIVKHFPHASIVAEESGFTQKDPDDIWIVDPIDGTSNFANGLPWFGVMIAHVIGGEVFSSGIYLPVTDEMYVAQIGNGAYKNGKRFTTVVHTDLSLCLVAFGTDGSEKSFSLSRKGRIYAALLPHVLNIRTTNCAVDYVYAVEGKLGGLINLENRIWDIAPILPIAREAGCEITDTEGNPVSVRVTSETIKKNFTLVCAQKTIHTRLLSYLQNTLVS
ncbi:MAG: inositol monophosphatase [bacterium]|nr:inositol monophosphatase [bacterium]